MVPRRGMSGKEGLGGTLPQKGCLGEEGCPFTPPVTLSRATPPLRGRLPAKAAYAGRRLFLDASYLAAYVQT